MMIEGGWFLAVDGGRSRQKQTRLTSWQVLNRFMKERCVPIVTKHSLALGAFPSQRRRLEVVINAKLDNS
jgi:hypothetical protein